MRIFLFTNFFPFKRAEPFLVNEFPYAETRAETITILSLYGRTKDCTIKSDESDKVKVLAPVLPSADKKFQLLLKGLFNLAPFGFHITELLRNVRKPVHLRYWLISLLMTRAALSSRSAASLMKAIAAAPVPVLYFYWGDNLAAMLPYLRKKLRHKKFRVVVRMHRTDLYEELKGNYIPLQRALLKYAELVVPISADGSNYLSCKYSSYINKIWLSRLGVPDRGINPAPMQSPVKTIVSVSSLTPVKRVQLILESLASCSIRTSWHHFGDGPGMNELKQTAVRVNSNLEIHLHGFVSNDEIMRFYMTTPVDLFVNASLSEGLPVSVMEAMSFGIPVVATDAGGTSDLVDETTGALVPVGITANELGREIDRILSLPNLMVLREQSRHRFEQLVNAEVNYPAFYERMERLVKG